MKDWHRDSIRKLRELDEILSGLDNGDPHAVVAARVVLSDVGATSSDTMLKAVLMRVRDVWEIMAAGEHSD